MPVYKTTGKSKGSLVSVHHEGVWGRGRTSPHILNLDTGLTRIISYTALPLTKRHVQLFA